MPTITENNGSMEPEEEDMDHYENDDRKSSEEETASGSGEGEEDQEEDEDEGGSSGNSNHFIYQPCQIQTDRIYCIVTDLLYFVWLVSKCKLQFWKQGEKTKAVDRWLTTMIRQQANAPPKAAAVGCFCFGLVPVIVFVFLCDRVGRDWFQPFELCTAYICCHFGMTVDDNRT